MGVLFWTCRSEGKLPSGQSNPHKWLASQKIWSVEELETLAAGTKPRTSHNRSPEERGVERERARRSSLKGRERAIVRRTLEPFQGRRWGNFWETAWSANGLFRSYRYHLEQNWTRAHALNTHTRYIREIISFAQHPGGSDCGCPQWSSAKTNKRSH